MAAHNDEITPENKPLEMIEMTAIERSGRLAGRVALVTGAGSRSADIGNGRAAAILLARHGARVLLIDSVHAAALETERMIAGEGGVSMAMPADVTQSADCQKAVQAAVDAWGRVDILVNNVGIGGPAGTAVDVDLEAWDHAMRVNVTAMMLIAKHAIP